MLKNWNVIFHLDLIKEKVNTFTNRGENKEKVKYKVRRTVL